MKKISALVQYGNRLSGGNEFDDDTDIPIVKDPDTGEAWISPMFTGVLSFAKDGYNSPVATHRETAKRFKDYISEWQSNSLGRNPDALKRYIDRYVRTMEAYRKEHGKYPKQRVIGHSRGGGGAVEFMSALNSAHPELPQVDEFFGIDPFDTLFARRHDVKRRDGKVLSRKSIVVRPKNMSFLHADEVPGIGAFQRNFGNLMVRFANPVNPLSRKNSLSFAVPETSHNALPRLFEAAVEAHRAKNRVGLRRYLRKTPEDDMIEASTSPIYGDWGKPIYEKAAEMKKQAFLTNPRVYRPMIGFGAGAALTGAASAVANAVSRAKLEQSLRENGFKSGTGTYDYGLSEWRRRKAKQAIVNAIVGGAVGAGGVAAYDLYKQSEEAVAGKSWRELKERAKAMKLRGWEILDEIPDDVIASQYNGIGPDRMNPNLRNAMTRLWSYYTPAALIHDMRFVKGGTKEDLRHANYELSENIDRLIDAKNPGAFKRFWLKRMNGLQALLMDRYSGENFNYRDKPLVFQKRKPEEKPAVAETKAASDLGARLRLLAGV